MDVITNQFHQIVVSETLLFGRNVERDKLSWCRNAVTCFNYGRHRVVTIVTTALTEAKLPQHRILKLGEINIHSNANSEYGGARNARGNWSLHIAVIQSCFLKMQPNLI